MQDGGRRWKVRNRLLGCRRVLCLALDSSGISQSQSTCTSALREKAPEENLLSRAATPEIQLPRGTSQRTKPQPWSTSRPEKPFFSKWLTTMSEEQLRGNRKSPPEFSPEHWLYPSRPQGPCEEGHEPLGLLSPAGAHCPGPLSHCHGCVTRTPPC